MEPRHEEQKDKVPQTEEKEEKPRRFRIVKLEERIAPNSPHGSANGCGNSKNHTFCLCGC